ncbi:OOP family OmpA-OmpF porin [Sphingomonas kaistensis]|uniref:OOP family OmpA-OmpF porin n=1 Tax=Sphingomonas kaistensis TaxID=298708 RepID=A0A7X5Y8A5_9SPHN|nr:OmpA family protein [Sphingomonas kaistensis]NJC06841.1 OOP family OmpA-OmpF porin [Sphingomonas kaistensis]
MSRLLVLLPLLALIGCNRAPPPREREPEAPPAATFDNATAAQSIVRPEVIAEVEHEQAMKPDAAPALPSSITITFPSGATLDASGEAALDRLLDKAKPVLGVTYILRGHSDSAGSDRDNLRTSRRRAEAVSDYLVEHGVPADSISVIAIGEGRPVSPNTKDNGEPDPDGQARNRRVEVEVIVPTESAPAPPRQ